jgi:hypothetical protein
VDAYQAVGLDDTDTDGIPNWWEIVFDLNPTNSADGILDPDWDGLLNWQEFTANTDPTNASSVLRLTEAVPVGPDAVAVAWLSGQEGFDTARIYKLYRSESIADDAEWLCVASNLNAAGAVTGYTNEFAAGSISQAFYRVAIAGVSNEVFSAPIALVPRR